MTPGAQCSAETWGSGGPPANEGVAGGGWRRLLARGCAVLGGTIAGTAVAWAVAAGTAAAD
ncbi:MAG: hypothetical protein ACRDQF_20200, partial [Thermocrispum sp.]